MIRIELDVIHRELLLLAGLFATFSGVVFPAREWNGINVTPLVAFGGVVVLGVCVLIHRRLFSSSTATQSRRRATVWFALVGAVLGAALALAVVKTQRSMILAAIGVGAMLSAIGTQFGIVIKSHEQAARDAVEAILDEENVLVTPDAWTNGATEPPRESGNETQTGNENRDTDETAANEWKPVGTDDARPIPVITSIESSESPEE